MQDVDPVAVVQAWQEAANARDIERLDALSTPDIEVGGPRGSGFGRELLEEWISRTGLTLETLRVVSIGNVVVAEQRGAGSWNTLNAPTQVAGRSASNPAGSCASTSFIGGAIWLVQYPNGSYDGDYAC